MKHGKRQFLRQMSVDFSYLVLLEAFVTRAFDTSMEVEVTVCSENPLTGRRLRTSTAFLTFVALDDHGRPSKVPPILPETAEELERYEGALDRRQRRLESRTRKS